MACDTRKADILLTEGSASAFCLSSRKGKFLHHYENYGATAKDIADWMKKWVLLWPQDPGNQAAFSCYK